MLEKGKNAKAEIKLELLDKTQLKVIAYNEEADYTIQNIRKNDIVFIYGMIKETEVIIKNIHIISFKRTIFFGWDIFYKNKFFYFMESFFVI